MGGIRMANTNDYLDHLLKGLNYQKQVVIKQLDKIDIAPPDALTLFEEWQQQIIEYAIANPPVYYLKSLILLQDTNQHIQSISYSYCNEFEYSDYVSASICWNEEDYNRLTQSKSVVKF